MPTAADRIRELFERILTLTEGRQIRWERDDASPSSYKFELPEGGKIVIDSRDDDGAPPFDFLVFGADGLMLGQIEWVFGTPSEPPPPLSTKLRRLYVLAEDSQGGKTEELERILRQLPEPDIPF